MEPLDSPTFCTKLFNGLMITVPGGVNSCCLMEIFYYGDARLTDLDKIMNNNLHKKIKNDSLNGIRNKACQQCWDMEDNPNTVDMSGRLHALKYYDKWMKDENSFKIELLDLRWKNTCNLACIMCDAQFSSKWLKELNKKHDFPLIITEKMKKYIYENIANFKEIYLAGGEPLQMKENIELLSKLLEINPNVSIRLNTNLSVIDTEVYKLLKQFPQENVQWNVSIDGELDIFEYVRWPGKWLDMYQNLRTLLETYDNVYCDILVNIVNCENVLLLANDVLINDLHIDPDRIKFTPLTHPVELDVRNYSEEIIEKIMKKTADFMVPHGKDNEYRSTMFMSALGLLTHMNNKNFTKDLDKTRAFLLKLDKRRNLDYKTLGTYLND